MQFEDIGKEMNIHLVLGVWVFFALSFYISDLHSDTDLCYHKIVSKRHFKKNFKAFQPKKFQWIKLYKEVMRMLVEISDFYVVTGRTLC